MKINFVTKIGVFIASLFLLLRCIVAPAMAASSLPELLSLSTSGEIADLGVETYGDGHAFDVSDDGRYVAFRSSSTNLGGTGRTVYVRDRQLGVTSAQTTVDANGDFSLSADGQKLMVLSTATDFDPRATDGAQHCFVKNLATDTVTFVSLDGSDQVVAARFCALSDDGNVVAYVTFGGVIYVRNLSTNVVAMPPHALSHLSLSGDGRYLSYFTVVYDVLNGTTASATAIINGVDTISTDGRYVFVRSTTNLDPSNPCPGPICSYRRDMVAETTKLIWDGAGGWSSRDGNIFAFPSNPPNANLIHIYNFTTGTTKLVGYNQNGVMGDGNFVDSVGLNGDGSLIGLITDSANFLPSGYSSSAPQLYLGSTTTSIHTIILDASGDTDVRSGNINHNFGAEQFMRVRSSGDNRGLVRFSQSALQASVGAGIVVSARLQLTIVNNGNNWGATGRTVDVYRLIANWAEGNGTENTNGTGSGATWNCAIDSIISNTGKNCNGATQWEMGQPNNPAVHPWVATATDSKTITNNQTGIVEYDVTSDVQSFLNGTNSNYGWLIKKTNENQNGMVSFGTRESSSVPQLVVTYQL